MAYNNGLNVIDAIIAAKLGKGAGGSGGVTKEYVDTQVGAVSERIDDVESVIPSTATPQNPLATTADVQNEEITVTASTSPLADSADGMVQKLTIYGRSEVVDGAIKSAGEGYAVVDLGTLLWSYNSTYQCFIAPVTNASLPVIGGIKCYINKYNSVNVENLEALPNKSALISSTELGNIARIAIKDTSYTDEDIFKTAMSGVILAYQLADPTQGNTLAVKTDDGTGIDGTMATFTTALPLRGVSDTVRDKLICTAESKQVETVCKSVFIKNLNIITRSGSTSTRSVFGTTGIDDINDYISASDVPTIKSSNFVAVSQANTWNPGNVSRSAGNHDLLFITEPTITTVEGFMAAYGDTELIYELAEPVITPLTTAEISACRSLRTFGSTTNITISDEPEFEFDYLKNTPNGQAVADIQKDLQGQISNMITVSPLLTLTAAGWDSTTLRQTVTFAHDTSRRNVIDITIGENAAWDAAGVYAVSETAAGITFECSEMPETALTFRVTSMEVS